MGEMLIVLGRWLVIAESTMAEQVGCNLGEISAIIIKRSSLIKNDFLVF